MKNRCTHIYNCTHAVRLQFIVQTRLHAQNQGTVAHYMDGLEQKHSAVQTSRLDFYLRLERVDVTSKEKLILDQLFSLFILVMLNGSFIFNGRQDCLSLTAFCQIIILNCY